jgi:2-dehydro-3-deoxyphosphooctonate aldolase (KDO 8-P synthase)
MANDIGNICNKLQIPWIYKSSFDKDCRSSPGSFHGLGLDSGLKILADVREEFGVPVVTDFSDPIWAESVGKVCDFIQVPAYLCRQSTILRAAAETKRPIHLKKGDS